MRFPIISDVADQVKKLANKNFLEQAMAACALVANADGSIDPEEKQAVLKYATEHNIFGVYSATEVEKVFNEQVAEVQVSETKALAKVSELKGKTAEATLLVNVAIAIGASDGDFDADEQAVVKKIIGALALDESTWEFDKA